MRTYSSGRWQITIFLELLLTISLIAAPVFCETGMAAEARAAIDDADNRLGSTFNMVLEAESYSVNISHLLKELNIAVALITEAELSYNRGNFTDAIQFARLSVDRINGLEDEVVELAKQGGIEYTQRLSVGIALSIAASCLVLISSVIGWSLLKSRYLRKASRLRPRLKTDD